MCSEKKANWDHLILYGPFWVHTICLQHLVKSQKVLLACFLIERILKEIVLCCLRVGLFGVVCSLFVHEKTYILGESKPGNSAGDLFGMVK